MSHETTTRNDMLQVVRRHVPGVTQEHAERMALDLTGVALLAADFAAREGYRRISAERDAAVLRAAKLERRIARLEGDQAGDRKAEGGLVEGQGATVNPTPQAGDRWEDESGSTRIVITSREGHVLSCRAKVERGSADGRGVGERFTAGFPQGHGWRLVERDGRPWPPAQEPEPGDEERIAAAHAALLRPVKGQDSQQLETASSAEPARAPVADACPAADVKPATDEQIERWLSGMSKHPLDSMHRALIARVRYEEDRADGWKRSCRDWEDSALKSDEAHAEAVARADRLADTGQQMVDGQRARAERAEADAQRWEDTAQAAAAGQALAEAERDEAREALDVAQREIRLLRAEVERMRPVVWAAVQHRDGVWNQQALIDAVDAYCAAGKEAGRG